MLQTTILLQPAELSKVKLIVRKQEMSDEKRSEKDLLMQEHEVCAMEFTFSS